MNRNNKISKRYEVEKQAYFNRVMVKKQERNKNKGGTKDEVK